MSDELMDTLNHPDTKKAVQSAVNSAVKKIIKNATKNKTLKLVQSKETSPDQNSAQDAEIITPPAENEPSKSLGEPESSIDNVSDLFKNKVEQNKGLGDKTPPQKPTSDDSFLGRLKATSRANIAGMAAGKGIEFLMESPKSAKFQQNDTYQKTGIDSVAAPIADTAAQGLPGDRAQTQNALEAAADITRRIGEPVAGRATEAAEGVARDSRSNSYDAARELGNSTEYLHQAVLNAEKSLTLAQQNAKIDPQRYMNNLGVGGRLLAAIGLVLSGAGAGLSGQPNMAMKVLQSNIDRDIASQQQYYTNLMEAAAKDQGIVLLAKDRKLLATNAFFAAQQSVLAGAQAAVDSVGAQAKFASGKKAAESMKFNLGQQLLQSEGNYGSFYQTVHAAGDVKNMDLLGVGTTALSDHWLGTNLGLNRQNPMERLSLFSSDSDTITPTVSPMATPTVPGKPKNFYGAYKSPNDSFQGDAD